MAGFTLIESAPDDSLTTVEVKAAHGQDVAVGDIVSLIGEISPHANPYVAHTVSGAGNPIFGVVIAIDWETATDTNKSYLPAGTAGTLKVVTDGLFSCEADAAVLVTNFGQNLAVNVTVPAAGRSQMTLNVASAGAASDQMRLVGCESASKLAAGDKLYVRINESQVKQEAGV